MSDLVIGSSRIVRHSKKKWEVTNDNGKALTFKTLTEAKKYAEQAPAPAKSSKTKVAGKKRTGPTKVERVIAMCQKGCTIDGIMQELGISKPAAQSLIRDSRHKGVAIKVEKSPAGVNVYRVV
jgi:hypothetical protein